MTDHRNIVIMFMEVYISSTFFMDLPALFPKQQVLKVFTDEKFKIDENGRKFSKLTGNTVGKGEIACYEQFLLFSTVFSKDLYCRHLKTRTCLGKG